MCTCIEKCSEKYSQNINTDYLSATVLWVIFCFSLYCFPYSIFAMKRNNQKNNFWVFFLSKSIFDSKFPKHLNDRVQNLIGLRLLMLTENHFREWLERIWLFCLHRKTLYQLFPGSKPQVLCHCPPPHPH